MLKMGKDKHYRMTEESLSKREIKKNIPKKIYL